MRGNRPTDTILNWKLSIDLKFIVGVTPLGALTTSKQHGQGCEQSRTQIDEIAKFPKIILWIVILQNGP